MSSDVTRSCVVQLDGSNFPTWKLQMRMILMKLGVWRIVEGKEVAPDDDEPIASWRKFMERRDKALANIVLGVAPNQLYLLGPEPKDPVEVWNLLINQFQKKTWANKLSLKRKLYGLKLKDQEPVQEHLKSMVELFDELAVIGEAVEEEDRVVHILTSLPPCYDMLVTALEACTEVPKLEVVTERILNEERKIKEKCRNLGGQINPVDNALFTHSKTKSCFYCGKPGHIQRFCKELKKKNNEEQEEDRKPEVANFSRTRTRVSSSKMDSDSEDECIALISEVKQKKDKWIIDSAATDHLCNDRRKMQNIHRMKVAKSIKVGNGQYVNAKFKGTVKVTVRSRNKTRKIKLQNVLLVPELKYNLLSVSKADELGKKTVFNKGGCCIIDNETEEVVVTATKVGKLYYLDIIEDNVQQKSKSHRREMEHALMSIKENNFKEEMMKRLNSIEKDRTDLKARLNEVEANSLKNKIYTFKEDHDQNRVTPWKDLSILESEEEDSVGGSEVEYSFEESEVEDNMDSDVEDWNGSRIEDDMEEIYVVTDIMKEDIQKERNNSNVEIQEDQAKKDIEIQEDKVQIQEDNTIIDQGSSTSQRATHVSRRGLRRSLKVFKNQCRKLASRAVRSINRK